VARPRGDPQLPGSGLGLAIAKRIVESHHGQIYVTSMPGKGSRFTFVLPITQHSAQTAVSA